MLPIERPSDWITLRSAGETSTATTTALMPATANVTSGQIPIAGRDEPRDALRVDERLAHLEPRDERRRHAGPVPLHELDEVEVRAHRDDQLGAALVREEKRDVLADAGADTVEYVSPRAVRRSEPGARPSA